MGKIRDFRDTSLKRVASFAKKINKGPTNLHICRYASGLVYWTDFGLALPYEYQALAEQFCLDLNKDLHHDGKWTVTWYGFDFLRARYTKIAWSFFDADDDLQFTVDADDGFLAVFMSIGDRMQHCEDAYNQWRETLKLNDIRPQDTIKAALGEKSKDPTAAPSVDLLALD